GAEDLVAGADQPCRADEDVAGAHAEQLGRPLRGEVGGLEAECAGEAVRPARVEHDRLDGAVGDDLLRPQNRVGLGPVAGEHRGADLAGSAVDDHGDIGPPGALEPGRDACRFESLRCGHAHGATPFTVRARSSGRPSARFMDCTAAPAVPLTRLSTAVITVTRFAARSTASPISAVLAPSTSAVRGKRPSGSSCTKVSSPYASSQAARICASVASPTI